ncbi:MAG: PfaD family polyunsaturated fatty acid/polyketide biosynthesis protein [Anaerolineae bacterium]|nr:PfaD family polyunsaturated fatty acid/polyketide biosynthesis protein [Gloeobacterales cyanobacterium ES-bin-313]
MPHSNHLEFPGSTKFYHCWEGSAESVAFDDEGMRAMMLNAALPLYVVKIDERIGMTQTGIPTSTGSSRTATPQLLVNAPPLLPEQLGDERFRVTHGVKYAYATGAMANGIASEEMVIALGRNGLLGTFGAGGLVPTRIEAAIHRIQQALPTESYAFNLIHSPSEPAIEQAAVDLYLKYGVTTVEASAFLNLTPNIIRYRVAGLSRRGDEIVIGNKIIAKVSRLEVATHFLQPAPYTVLKQMVDSGQINQLQAQLAEQVPMCDDLTVEADSGGHTDNRPLVCLLPAIIALRDEIQERFGYTRLVRVGAAGGIGTPLAVHAAFSMGAAYVVTGSVNQSCLEAGASRHTKKLLAEAELTDVAMAPAADMFELGVKLQVLKRGTLFASRAQKLFELYRTHESLDAISSTEREKLEKQIFRRSLAEVWRDTITFFEGRDPVQIQRAMDNPKRKMALVFRWYLGLSSHWSNAGETGREADYQIWCGPAMGAFNQWVKNTYLAESANRSVLDVSWHLMRGAAILQRLEFMRLQGLRIPMTWNHYRPDERAIQTSRVLEVHR